MSLNKLLIGVFHKMTIDESALSLKNLFISFFSEVVIFPKEYINSAQLYGQHTQYTYFINRIAFFFPIRYSAFSQKLVLFHCPCPTAKYNYIFLYDFYINFENKRKIVYIFLIFLSFQFWPRVIYVPKHIKNEM